MVELEFGDEILRVPEVIRNENGSTNCQVEKVEEPTITSPTADLTFHQTDLTKQVHQQFQKIKKLVQRQDEQVLFPCLPVIGTVDSIGISERDSAVSSIRSIHLFYGFSADTFAAAVHYLDRFLSKVKVKSRYLSCVAAAAYFLSIKMNEESKDHPRASELARLHQFIWKSADLKRMERIMLEKLGWDLWPPVTCLHFLRSMFDMLRTIVYNIDEEFFFTLVTRSEIYMNHNRCSSFKPSTLAISILQQCLKETGLSSPVTSYIILHIQAVCQVPDSELFECQCAISQQLQLYFLHPATHPSCLPVPKPATRPQLVSRPSFYGNTDLPTIEEVPFINTARTESSESGLDRDSVQKHIIPECSFKKEPFFGDKMDAEYGQLKCNITKS